eukprot:8685527-Ditylum_brightwellii.AAC.1
MDWVDKNNYRVSHYGIHPNQLCWDGIHFDEFHLQSAVTHQLLNYLWKITRSMTPELMEAFSKLLLKAWGKYVVALWDCNKALSLLKGMEIVEFIRSSQTCWLSWENIWRLHYNCRSCALCWKCGEASPSS